ncbi:methylenetetrahydrofolate reductase [NAD(P)H] [Sulfitobacter geojensis]|jgi:methylenetetrahydrofolate reductase (NADPH)|uniref:Methylenetetrahydrofolate reductase n=1 Tax=Sulfitobacter geojensis TaxID=1342299 RepID=A0AAE2VX08_9RHOB|nr:methylenetetrahydrofolate reductase [NAD(P)H] [Sulfitobacter geojensis]MBM1688934.1 methylenetetrahydrofolate reductase [NAD(P)H] [Sulfitobacter geojensis]MBM1693001.1 methylenetetrahydrofolate reductase [NAD(P)H] [Sulfitobacter geojensis]MBM1705167.1 methylenetetrahydrofolate reductase [NAD(P)H] [Sulfitobacter geojensis]MBM1709225.1 methylenetetrahydrofolate reductase [NAD(P)H] [Sulfitobacter geojensis]MBM1713290.1 methylenetetrahydrofolate reductase [NAD(P)H] [Sulfitobacter geojensis]
MTSPRVSFEVFPPRNVDAGFNLWDTAQMLAPLEPRFFSVTYGAGGTTRDLTHDAAHVLRRTSGLPVAAHLTCVGASKAETLEVADTFAKIGVTDIVALRGDPQDGAKTFTPHPEGFADSCALIEALADKGTFNIRVGAYPDSHPEAADMDANVQWLKRKFEAGADEAITQFFFETDSFLRFRDACAKAGIDKPITPGILPVLNWKSARNFAKRCGTPVPAWLDDAFEAAIRDDRHDLLATALCTEMCSTLVEEGVEDLHFYTLNRAELTRNVCRALGVTPQVSVRDVA